MGEFWLINVFNRDSAATLEYRELKAIWSCLLHLLLYGSIKLNSTSLNATLRDDTLLSSQMLMSFSKCWTSRHLNVLELHENSFISRWVGLKEASLWFDPSAVDGPGNDSNTGSFRSKMRICLNTTELTNLCGVAAIIKNNLPSIWHVPHWVRSGTKWEKKSFSGFQMLAASPMTSFLLLVKLVILEGSCVWHQGVIPHTLWCMCQFSQGPLLPLHSSPVGQDLQPGFAPSLASRWQRVTRDGP